MKVYAQAASHFMNNATVLLPSSKRRLQYKLVEPAHFKFLLGTSVDVRFVDPITRYGRRDCPAQAQEFGLGNPINFQQHLALQVLLRCE